MVPSSIRGSSTNCSRSDDGNDPLDELTPREREVLASVAEGYSNAGIARRLYINEGTVEKHVQRIFAKLRIYRDR